MMVWVHDIQSGADVLINTEYVTAVERDKFDLALFRIRMVNHDSYIVADEDSAAWLTMQE